MRQTLALSTIQRRSYGYTCINIGELTIKIGVGQAEEEIVYRTIVAIHLILSQKMKFGVIAFIKRRIKRDKEGSMLENR
jgi:hypothetical protein